MIQSSFRIISELCISNNYCAIIMYNTNIHFVDPHVGLYCSIAVFLLLSLATVHNHWIYIIIVIPGSPSFIRAVEYFKGKENAGSKYS